MRVSSSRAAPSSAYLSVAVCVPFALAAAAGTGARDKDKGIHLPNTGRTPPLVRNRHDPETGAVCPCFSGLLQPTRRRHAAHGISTPHPSLPHPQLPATGAMPCPGGRIVYGWPSRSTTWPWQHRRFCYTAPAAHSHGYISTTGLLSGLDLVFQQTSASRVKTRLQIGSGRRRNRPWFPAQCPTQCNRRPRPLYLPQSHIRMTSLVYVRVEQEWHKYISCAAFLRDQAPLPPRCFNT